MVLDAGTGKVRLIADPSELSAQIGAGVKGAVAGARGSLTSAGVDLAKTLTNPLIVGGAVTAIALNFENAFTRIDASSNASAKDIARWKDQVLDLATATGKSPRELADGLFFLASAGLKTSQVMDTLDQAAKASTAGFGTVADIAKLTANVLNAYADSGVQASDVTDVLAAAVREGTADTDEFAGAMGRVLPIASAAGVGFDQVAASLASLSNIGLDVNEGTTALRGLLQSIVSPTTQSAEALEKLGISTDDLRNVLSEQGLLGALDLLNEKSGGNLDTLRQLIPNVRSLTGFLGLTGDQAEKVSKVFDALTHASGSLNDAFEATQQGPGFAFKQALAELEVVAIQIGDKILPAVVDALKLVTPALSLAADHATELLTAFLLYKGAKFLPVLLGSIAEGLQAVAAASGIAILDGVGATFSVLASGAAKASLGTGALALAFGSVSGVAQTTKADLEQINGLVASYTTGLAAGTLTQTEFNAAAATVGEELGGNAEAFKIAATFGITYEQALFQVGDGLQEVNRHAGLASRGVDELTTHVDKSGAAVKNFAHLSDEALKDFRKGVVDSVQVTIGQFDHLKDAFKTTPTELARQAHLAVQIARTQHADLRAIFGSKDLSDAQKQALASLPADQRHAFAEGGKAIRQQITRDAVQLQRLNAQNFKQLTDGTTPKAKSGGKEVGTSLTDGMKAGIVAGSPAVAEAAASAVRAAIAAAKRAGEIQSPSKLMMRVGEQLMEGLSVGIDNKTGKLSDQLHALVGLIRDNIGVGAADQVQSFGRSVDELGRKFSRLATKIGSFRDAIAQGFSVNLADVVSGALQEFDDAQQQFLDDQAAFNQAAAEGQTGLTAPTAPTAPDLGALIAQQVADKLQLGQVLRKLSNQGLSAVNLQDIAGLGTTEGIAAGQAILNTPGLIDQMNQAQQDIADVLQATSDKLTDTAFGDKVEALGGQFDDLIDSITDFLDGLKLPKLSDDTRDFLDALRHATTLLQNLGGGNADKAPHLAGGGSIARTGLAVVHAGETVVPAGVGARQVVINVTVPGGFVGSEQAIVERLRPEMERIIRNNGSFFSSN